MIHHLSKSRIQSGRQCHKRLWLELHNPDAADWGATAQARLEEGTRFGELARTLLGGGILIEADHRHVQEALDETGFHLANTVTGTPMLFEPAFSHDGVRVRVDAYRREEEHDTLIEVKSTTGVKDEHVWDCAIQTWVARGNGRHVTHVMHAHVDNTFVYETEGDYTGLLKLADITDDVDALIPAIPALVARLKEVATGSMPVIATGTHCTTPYGCPFTDHCRANEPPAPQFPVDLLPRGGALVHRLVEAGYRDLREVPTDALHSDIHLRVAEATRTGVTFVSPELCATLAAIPYPRYYLDFETVTFVTPRWIGTRPFQQIPFQFSCHVEPAEGSLRHTGFLDLSGHSPLAPFVDSLIEAVGDHGPVLVWNRGFEATRIRELAMLFPHRAEALLAIVGRIVDLLPIYREHYYHRDMRGSWSIKAVLPTVAPDLDYGDLHVGDGAAAQAAYLTACSADTDDITRQQIRENLIAYCERDTLAMVRLARGPAP